MNWKGALNEFSTFLFTVEKKLANINSVDFSYVHDLTTFKNALKRLRIYYFMGPHKQEVRDVFKRKILTKILIHKKEQAHVQFLCEMLKEDIWTGLTYWLFVWTFESLNVKEQFELNHVLILQKIIDGFRTKEFVLAALDIFKMSLKLLLIRTEDEFIWTAIFLNRSHQKNSIYSYNIITYVLPAIRKNFETDYIMENIYLLLEKQGFQKRAWALHILKLLMKDVYDLPGELRKHYQAKTSDCNQIVFEILCKMKRKYNRDDIIFITNYLRKASCKDLKHLGDMIVTFITYCNPHRSTTDRFLEDFHKLANNLLQSTDIDKVEKSVIIFKILIKFNKNERLIARYQIKPINFEDDIPYCVERLDFNTIPYIFELLTEFETEGLIDKTSMWNRFMNICVESKTGHLDEKIIPFLKFMSKKFLPDSEIMFEFLVEVWGEVIEIASTATIIECQNKLYVLLKVLTIAIKEYEILIRPRYKTPITLILRTVYDIYFGGEANFDYPTLKYAEKIVTVTAELLVLITKDHQLPLCIVEDIFINLEIAMNCNMRFSATAVATFYKQFVSAQYMAFQEYFYTYIIRKLQKVSEELAEDSMLRRSGEYRMLIHAFCTAVPAPCRKHFIEEIMRNLVGGLKSPINPSVKAVSFHCITQLIQDRTLKTYTDRFLEPLIYYGLLLANESYKLNTAAILLLEVCVKRILPNDDNEKNMCLEDFFYLYPRLMILFEIIQKEPYESHTFSKAVFLSIFQRTNANNSCLSHSDYNMFMKPCKKMVEQHKLEAGFILEAMVANLPINKLTAIFENFFKKVSMENSNDCLFYWWLFNLLCTKYTKYKKMFPINVTTLEDYNALSLCERFCVLEQINVYGCGKKFIQKFVASLVCMKAITSDLQMLHILEIQLNDVLQRENPELEDYNVKYFIPHIFFKIRNKAIAENVIEKVITGMYNRGLSYKLVDQKCITSWNIDDLCNDLAKSAKYTALFALILADFPHLIPALPKRVQLIIIKHLTTRDDITIAIAFSKYGTLMGGKLTILLNSLNLIITSKSDCTSLKVICDIFNLPSETSLLAITSLLDYDFLFSYFGCKRDVVEFVVKFRKLLKVLMATCDSSFNVIFAKEVFLKAVEQLMLSENNSES